MKNITRTVALLLLCSSISSFVFSQQKVEGFDSIVFHFNANQFGVSKDFRGVATGYMTAGWWNPGQMKEDNILAWKTATVPEKKTTTFSFIGASSIVPTEFTRANY